VFENHLGLFSTLLEGMIKTNLKIISSENGSVMHGIKKTDDGFVEFGEMYFSSVEKDAIKAWKLHKIMTLNLIVPVGKVLLCFLDLREKSTTYKKTFKIILSQNPYIRLTVPPGIWFGFKGVSLGLNLISNVSNIPHDPNEVIRKEVDEIEMEWSIE